MQIKIEKDKILKLTMSFNYEKKRHIVSKSYPYNSIENIENFLDTITDQTGYIFKKKEKDVKKLFIIVGRYKTRAKRLSKKQKEKKVYDKLGNILTGILDKMYQDDLQKVNN